MSNDDKDFRADSYSEFIFTNTEGNKIYEKNKSTFVTWYEENKIFSSMYEVQEYISSEIYPEILHNYNGYKTTDPKLAYSLLFELIKIKTHGYLTREVYADIDLIDEKLYYLVWISSE
ncbi:hypothetical protein [Paenibacillus faecalis]|uniref:hypothetical protein n=1 Tax=Paenibacillus faecalis TaxID=2079532 RepID=UPI000D0EB20C|nr:hypothetical protein [Paenibacillus faecalis]